MADILIDSLAFGGDKHTFTLPYGECTTEKGTAAKTVLLSNFALETGARFAVKFSNGCSVASPTLNVNSTGAKSMVYKGATIQPNELDTNQVYEFIYDGTRYVMLSTIDVYSKAESDNLFAANDAMIFKGTIGTGGTVSALPASHDAGWTYRVVTAGTYAGQKCEVGDLIIALVDNYSGSDSNDYWTVAQTNIDGAVVGPASSTDAHVAVFDGTSGKVIKDSGFTIGTSVPADAKFTDTVTTVDSAISSTSTNPVQNKVIKTELDKYLPLSGGIMAGIIMMQNNKIIFGDDNWIHNDDNGRIADTYDTYSESNLVYSNSNILKGTTYLGMLLDEEGQSGLYLNNGDHEPCRLANIKAPKYAHDAANKQYVDDTLNEKFRQYGTIHQHVFTASQGQTDFLVPYNFATSELLMVYYNGLLLAPGENYTVNGQTVSLVEWSANAGDIITAVSLAASEVTSTASSAANDYAEYRDTDVLEPGRCVIETGNDDLIQSTERLQPGANIISDTYGSVIGDASKGAPIAVAGRVLAYPLEDRESYRKAPGMPVCSGPNGTVSLMTREEMINRPECIVGYVSSVPKDEKWGNAAINGRIWIKVK